MNDGDWDRLTTVFVNRRRNWNGDIDYSYIYFGFHPKEPYLMSTRQLDLYWYIRRNRRWNEYVNKSPDEDEAKYQRILA